MIRILLISGVLIASSFSFSQNLIDKCRLHRIIQNTNKGKFERVDRLVSKLDQDNDWDEKYSLMSNYPKMIRLANQIGSSIKIDSLEEVKEYQNLLLDEDDRFIALKGDTNFLLKRNYQVERIRSTLVVLDEFEKSIKLTDSLHKQLVYKKEYETPEELDTLITEILPVLIDSLAIDGKESTNYLIKIERAGKNGEDLVVTLDLFYQEDNYGYPLGFYKSPAIDYPIKIFSNVVKSRLRKNTKVRISIKGEADSNRPDGLTYDGKIGRVSQDGFNIWSGKEITNKELAYLRALNAQQIFKSITSLDVANMGYVDHLDISTENKGGEYRKVTMTAYFFGYYSEEYDKLSPEAREAVAVDRKVVEIKRDQIIRD